MKQQPTMRRIRIRHRWVSPEKALEIYSIDVLSRCMDADARDRAARDLAGCSDLEFLRRYLEIAPEDMIIG